MTEEQKTYQIDLKEASHFIGFGIALPSDVKKFRHVRQFTTDSLQTLSDYVNRYVQASQRVALFIPKDCENEESIVRILDDHCEKLMIGERTMHKTASLIGRQIIENIYNHWDVPYITDYNKPLKGVPAFIVYSGPSLDKNIGLLSECEKRGVVFCSNTPAEALKNAGVIPDVGVCLESRETYRSFDDIDPMLYVCDMTAPESSWAVHSKYKAGMFQPDLAYLKYALENGTIPMANGGFVGSAMVSLAYQWHADPIVLIGFDLALTDDKMCAEVIDKGDFVKYTPDGMFVLFGGTEHPSKGLSFLTEAPAWGDPTKTVKTTYERKGYLEWMVKFATLAQDVELINATEGGAHIAGWTEIPLREALKTGLWHSKIHGHRETLYEQSRALHREFGPAKRMRAVATLRRISSVCDRIIGYYGDNSPEAELAVRKLSRDEPIIYCLLAPRFVQLRYERPNTDQRIKKVREIIEDCAGQVRDHITEVMR